MVAGHVMFGATESFSVSLTVKVQLDLSPTRSTAVHTTVVGVGDTVKFEPDAGWHVTIGGKLELSVAVGLVQLMGWVSVVDDTTIGVRQVPIIGAATREQQVSDERR